ncbi:MAG: hypothetical protein K8T25_13120 [Planctomycetia bacterium]|nr:hypothetical protein [Planctomycetia bacterium]
MGGAGIGSAAVGAAGSGWALSTTGKRVGGGGGNSAGGWGNGSAASCVGVASVCGVDSRRGGNSATRSAGEAATGSTGGGSRTGAAGTLSTTAPDGERRLEYVGGAAGCSAGGGGSMATRSTGRTTGLTTGAAACGSTAAAAATADRCVGTGRSATCPSTTVRLLDVFADGLGVSAVFAGGETRDDRPAGAGNVDAGTRCGAATGGRTAKRGLFNSTAGSRRSASRSASDASSVPGSSVPVSPAILSPGVASAAEDGAKANRSGRWASSPWRRREEAGAAATSVSAASMVVVAVDVSVSRRSTLTSAS